MKCIKSGCSNSADWNGLCSSCYGKKEMTGGVSDVGNAVGGVGKAVGGLFAGVLTAGGGGIGGILTLVLSVYVALNLDAVIAILVGIFWTIVGLIIAVKAIKKYGLVSTLKYGALAGGGIFLLLCLYFFVIYPVFIDGGDRKDVLPGLATLEAGEGSGPVPAGVHGAWQGLTGDGIYHGSEPTKVTISSDTIAIGHELYWLKDVSGVEKDGVFTFKAMMGDDSCTGELETLSDSVRALSYGCRDDYRGELKWSVVILNKGAASATAEGTAAPPAEEETRAERRERKRSEREDRRAQREALRNKAESPTMPVGDMPTAEDVPAMPVGAP